MGKLSISVVAPAYNEAENLTPFCKELTVELDKICNNFEIIIIDDGSKDDSFSVLQKIKETNGHLKIIQLRRNFGQSAALDAGIKESRGEIIVTIDADGQNDPKDIKTMLKRLIKGKFDCVCGWRQKRQDSISKKIISKGAAFLGKLLVNPGIHDSGCTLRVYRRECFNNFSLYGEMHRMIPALLRWRGFNLTEIKINHRPRKYGQTKYNWYRIINGLTDMINVWFWRKYAARPMHIFGLIGTILMFSGGCLLVYLAIARYFFNYSLVDKIWPMVGFFAFLTGVQFFVFGILASILIQNNKNEFYLIKQIIE
jgi:glycosyltransferase involved in cell wall biosynthesis